MRLSSLAALGSIVLGGSLVAAADSIPYPNVGSVAPTNVFTATATGNVTGYFYFSTGADTDVVRMLDLTKGTTSVYVFDNQTTTPGTSANFGSVKAGDVLVFEVLDTSSNTLFASDPAYSPDKTNHAYTTGFTSSVVNGVLIPNGIFVGLEDEWVGFSDLNYNDDNFVVTNVSAVDPPSIPEPSTLMLLGTGALGAFGAFRRKLLN